jgi:hypothetical protein
MGNVSEKFVKKIKTHFVFSNFFYRNLVRYEIIREGGMLQPGRRQMATALAHCVLDA